MAQYKGIIFDLDGTLIDSVGDICAFSNKALAQYGYPTHTIDKYIEWIGDGARKLMLRALPSDISDERFEKLFADYLKIYELDVHEMSVLYKGIPELLDAITASGITMTMLTNKPHDVMLKTLDSYFTKWDFKIALGQRDNMPQKPDPAEALNIAKQLGLKPEEMVFIGDSAVDIKTGKAAGMDTICVTAGYESRENIMAANATHVIDTHLEILPLLKL